MPHGLPDASLWPTWLLRPPQRLAVQGQPPCYQGPLRLLAGPHRLEAAWWEAADAPESPQCLRCDPAPAWWCVTTLWPTTSAPGGCGCFVSGHHRPRLRRRRLTHRHTLVLHGIYG